MVLYTVREPAEISHSSKYYSRAREMMELNHICVETKTLWLEQERGTSQLQLINVVLTEITSSLNR